MARISERNRRILKEQVKEALREILHEATAVHIPVKKGKLTRLLGLKDDEHVEDLSAGTIASRLGRLISRDEISYADAIRMLNAAQVFSKNNNPSFSELMRSTMSLLRRKFKSNKR